MQGEKVPGNVPVRGTTRGPKHRARERPSVRKDPRSGKTLGPERPISPAPRANRTMSARVGSCSRVLICDRAPSTVATPRRAWRSPHWCSRRRRAGGRLAHGWEARPRAAPRSSVLAGRSPRSRSARARRAGASRASSGAGRSGARPAARRGRRRSDRRARRRSRSTTGSPRGRLARAAPGIGARGTRIESAGSGRRARTGSASRWHAPTRPELERRRRDGRARATSSRSWPAGDSR